jgi:hypothetical protein
MANVGAVSATRIFVAMRPSAMPAMHPAAASTRLSDSNWRITALARAPIAMRMAISLRRSIALASNSPATFAHAMSSTKPTAAISTSTAGLMSAIMYSRRTPAAIAKVGLASTRPGFWRR